MTKYDNTGNLDGHEIRSTSVKYYCPNCEKIFKNKDQDSPLPTTCPECGADLYPEEILFQQLISETDCEILV
jgi:DNA-directed RNA polymerase subunit RPC12/RpoP